MTIHEWLDSRTPSAPPALRARVQAALAEHLDDDAGAAPERCVDAAVVLLRDLVRRESTRDAALDLLAADALATYALEAAADTPARMRAVANDSMARYSAVAADVTP